MTFGTLVRDLRGATSQEGFAARLAITAATVSRWESGDRCPSPRDVGRIADVLDLGPTMRARLLDAALAYVPTRTGGEREATR